MALVNFKKGLRASLPTTKTEGTFYVATDERSLYLDIDASTRIRLGDFQEFANIEALRANVNPSTTALYYVADINCLAKWDGSQYVQINTDTGATSVEVVGTGNAVTASSYDPITRKLTLTKGETFATQTYVGSIPDTYTETNVIAYVNKKAEETLAAAQGGSSETAASVKLALDNYKAATDPRLDALEDDTHTHDNKAELDKIETGDKAKWDAVAADYLTSADKTTLETAIGKKADQTALTAEIDRAKAAEEANANAITAIKDGTTIDSFKDVEDALATKQAVGDYATKAEAQGYADAKDTAIAAAKKAGDDAQADVDALEAKVGTVTEGKTVVEMIADAQTAATYDDTAIKASIKDNADAIDVIEADYLKATDKTELQGNINAVNTKVDTLIDTDTGKSVRTIANEELAAQLIPENAKESLDTLTEIATWIQNHPDDASAMNAAIEALQAKVDTGDQKVSEYVTAAINALNIGDYAKAADLTALAGRVANLETDTHTHNNKALLDTYTQTEANLADAVAKRHDHTNKAVLDTITQEMIDSLSWGSF